MPPTAAVKTPELEDDVFHAILVVVDFHLVEHVWIERKEVRTVRRFKERVHIEDHGYRIWTVEAHECVPVCNVGRAVKSGYGRLAMACCECADRNQHRYCQQYREKRAES